MDSKSAESDAVKAIVRSTELSAKIDEERLREIRELREGQKRIEMFMMRDAVINGTEERSGATDRLNVLSLEIARLQASLSRMSEQVTKFMIHFDTLRRELIRRESLPERIWRWYVERNNN